MISPVTIYVPVPAGVASRQGAAPRSAAEAGARLQEPVRPVERIAPGDQHGQPSTKFRAVLDDQTAEELASRRRARPRRQDDLEDGKFEVGSGRPESAAHAADPAAAQNPADGFEPSLAVAGQRPPPSRALTASLDGPDRPRAIDAVYRTIESFGGDIAQRGAIFDFIV